LLHVSFYYCFNKVNQREQGMNIGNEGWLYYWGVTLLIGNMLIW